MNNIIIIFLYLTIDLIKNINYNIKILDFFQNYF